MFSTHRTFSGYPQELDLKVRQFEQLLHAPPPLQDTPNVNLLWARLMVEELCRLGASTFCIAPGAPEQASCGSAAGLALASAPMRAITACLHSMTLWWRLRRHVLMI